VSQGSRAPLRPIVRPVAWRDPLAAFAPHAARPGAALLFGGGRILIAPRPSARVGGGVAALDAVLAARRGVASPGFGPFAGGVVGYFGYELAGRVERLPAPHAAGPSLPDLSFGVFDAAAVFDPATRRAAVVGGGGPEPDPAAGARLARERAAALAAEIAAAPDLAAEETWSAVDWTPDWSRIDHEARVRRVLGYIRAGDIFQANLAQRFTAPRPAGMTPFGLFRRLCRINPAPFAAFVSVDRSAPWSPPRRSVLRVAAGARHVETRPIKGTRPRGRTPKEDAALAAELLASAKNRAENLMIVDLLRNDLARTSVAGSVRVPELWSLESHATVHHLVSAVTARPRPGVSALEILRQAFPGGSITGAPKIRAMEIIHELEGARRGPYCGAIGWISDDGAMDTAIAIRTVVVDGETLSVSAGGGIGADSDPAEEYRETLVKAAALLRAVTPDPHILRAEGL
jgi:para-aminobenzoate synthetase component 1